MCEICSRTSGLLLSGWAGKVRLFEEAERPGGSERPSETVLTHSENNSGPNKLAKCGAGTLQKSLAFKTARRKLFFQTWDK